MADKRGATKNNNTLCKGEHFSSDGKRPEENGGVQNVQPKKKKRFNSLVNDPQKYATSFNFVKAPVI